MLYDLLAIPGFPKYYIGKFGNVFSVKKSKIIQLKALLDTSGYPSLNLRKDGKTITIAVHRLMGITYLDKRYREKKLEVNHRDGVKTNNHLDNLELVTHRENVQHAYNNGLIKSNKPKGEKNPYAKLNESKVRKIKSLLRRGVLNQTEIANTYGVSSAAISDIYRRKTWRHIK